MREPFAPSDAARWIAVPTERDDKYSRGVLGLVTGSAEYPGAAVLGAEAALRTGVGMLRYLGPGRPTRLVLQRRPEAVTAGGRVQAWVLGSGQSQEPDDETAARLEAAIAQRVPVVLDAGALGRVPHLASPGVLVPHAGELAALVRADRGEIEADPQGAAAEAARTLGHVVLLKGSTTVIAHPSGRLLTASSATPWLATAGAGDALAGVLGALLATHQHEIAADPAVLTDLAAAAAVLHGLAAQHASAGGPLTVLDLCAALPGVIAGLVAEHRG